MFNLRILRGNDWVGVYCVTSRGHGSHFLTGRGWGK